MQAATVASRIFFIGGLLGWWRHGGDRLSFLAQIRARLFAAASDCREYSRFMSARPGYPQACCGAARNVCCDVSAPRAAVFKLSAAPLPPPKPAIACTI